MAGQSAGFPLSGNHVAADSAAEIPLSGELSEAECRQILIEWNTTTRDYPRKQCLHQLIEEQTARTPEAVAVLFEEQELSYSELNERANHLAHHLQALGVGPDVLVGLCVKRSLELVVGVLGILKVGGAYVPLDPHYPAERLAFIVADTHLPFLVTQQDVWAGFAERMGAESGPQLVYFDELLDELIDHESGRPLRRKDNLSCLVTPQDLAYVLYTSGSTGQPKGVAIEHHGPVALMSWGQRVYSRAELAGVLAATSICFDLSVYELFLPLTVGGIVILAQNVLQLPTLRHRDHVTLINTVPSAMEELVRQQGLPASVQTINLAGEPLSRALVDTLYALPTVQKVYDLSPPGDCASARYLFACD